MDVELKFRKNDLDTQKWLIKELGVDANEFVQIRSFDGSSIMVAIFVAIETLVRNPTIIDKFLKREGCEVEFDEQGNLLRASGYTAADVIKMKAKNDNHSSDSK